MTDAGIGETQLNNLLADINLPVLSKCTLKKRENEAGITIPEYHVIKQLIKKSPCCKYYPNYNNINGNFCEIKKNNLLQNSYKGLSILY